MDEEYWELFIYRFSLSLKDADKSKDLIVRLQYKNPKTGKWTNCPDKGDTVRTLTYTGNKNVWKGELVYDVLSLKLGMDEYGRLWPVRIACDYTLTNGKEGTVYSTDCGPLYAFKGEYLEAVSAQLKDGVITAVFQVDKELVKDTSKLTLLQASRIARYSQYNIKEKADISSVDKNGRITVKYTLEEGETLDFSVENSIYLRYIYEDDGIAEWESAKTANIKNPPVVMLDPHVFGPVPEGWNYPVLYFEMTLNSLKGGTAEATLYVDSGNGFKKASKSDDIPYYTGTIVYDPNEDTEDVWSHYMLYKIDPPEGGGFSGRAKIVFDITYPDGEKATIETDTRPIHNGAFAKIDENYGLHGFMLGQYDDPETGEPKHTMSFEVIIDDTLVDPEKVDIYSDSLWHQEWNQYYYNAEILRYTDEEGKYRIRYTYVSDSEFPTGNYWFTPSPYYDEDENNTWSMYDFYLRFSWGLN